MKKVICLCLAVLLCLSIAVPAFAAENEFVPSITYKPQPEIIPEEDGGIGVIRDKKGEAIDSILPDCLCVTPVANIWDDSIVVPKKTEERLLAVYNGLVDGSMELPYEKFGAGLDASNMVIRDLFDVDMICETHRKMLEKKGNTLELTFNLGVAPDEKIFAMVLDAETQEWLPVETVNNGDGTVTCTLEKLGVVAFSVQTVEAPENPEPEQTPGFVEQIVSFVKEVVNYLVNLLDRIMKWF